MPNHTHSIQRTRGERIVSQHNVLDTDCDGQVATTCGQRRPVAKGLAMGWRREKPDERELVRRKRRRWRRMRRRRRRTSGGFLGTHMHT